MASRRITALIIMAALVLGITSGAAALERSPYRLGEIGVTIVLPPASVEADAGRVIQLLERFRAILGDLPASGLTVEIDPAGQMPFSVGVGFPAGPVEGPGQSTPTESPTEPAQANSPGEPAPKSSGASASTLRVLHIRARDLPSLARALWQVWLPAPGDRWLERVALSTYIQREMLFGAGLIGASEYRLAIDEEWSLYRSYLKPKVSDFPLLAAPEKLPSSVATAKGRLFLRLLDLRIQGYTGGSRSLWDVIRTGAATGQGWTLRGALERASEEWNLPLIPLYIRYAEKGGTILPADLWETMVFVDGQRLAVDVAPTIIRGRTVVPLRAIFEALGAEVKWDAGTSRVTAIKDGRTVILTVGSLRAQVDDKHYLLDAAPIISNGRVLVPLRFSGEAFGAEVAWEAETLKILLTSGMGTPVSFPEFTGYSPVAGRLQGGGDDAPVAYLTFDDGPTRKVTPMVLDILARYNVKGTFFVIGTRVQDLPELTRRIVREGHALGNHTWNHDYSDIYRSPEVFLASVRRAEESLFQIAGVRPDIVRAPGGTFGHFTPEYFAIMKQNGYAVINWNVSSGDTTLPVPPADVIAANVIENAKPKSVRKNAVILLHDGAGHESSAEALPTIIEYFLSLGYRFEVLTPDNPLAK